MECNVTMSIWTPEFFGKPKVNDIEYACLVSNAHENIAGFEIMMHNVLRVNMLKTMDL